MSNVNIFLLKRTNGVLSQVSAQDLNLIYGESGSIGLTKGIVKVSGPYGSTMPDEILVPITGENSIAIGGNLNLSRTVYSPMIFGDVNMAGPNSTTIAIGSRVSGRGAVAIGGSCSYAIEGGVALGGFCSRVENFGIVNGGFSASSGCSNIILGGTSLTTAKSRFNIILGGSANAIADTSNNNLRPGLSYGTWVPADSNLCGPNTSSLNAIHPEYSIIGAGNCNYILSGKNNFIMGGIRNCMQSSCNTYQQNIYIPAELASGNLGHELTNNNNVILGGEQAGLTRSNNTLILGGSATLLNAKSNNILQGNFFPAFNIDGSSGSCLNLGCNENLSAASVIIGGCSNSATNYIPRPAQAFPGSPGAPPIYLSRDVKISNRNIVVLGGDGNKSCSSNTSVFGQNNIVAISGDKNLIFGTSYNIGNPGLSVQDPAFGGASGIVLFSDYYRNFYPGTSIPTETKRGTLYKENSNSLIFNFANGIFMQSESGVVLNGKRYSNIRKTITVDQNPNNILGQFV